MEFRILGPLEVAEGGVPVELGAPKQRALLAVLLLHANEVVSAERLVDELWGEAPPARARKLVQHYVSGLRKVLPDGVLLTRAPGYLLRVEPGQLDLFEFERLVDKAKRARAEGDLARAADLYRHADSLWRGQALEDAALEGQSVHEAARLDDLRLVAVMDRVDLELELGRHAELIGELELLAERHAWQERLRVQLMLALYRAGRQAEALQVYQVTRRWLLETQGLEPSHDLRRLERAILEQDPALDLPTEAGQPADAAEPVEPRRKTVTVHAAVLTTPQSDPEAFGRALSEAYAKLAAAAVYHGGRAERLAGGELIAVFGVPEAHEDDALRALRAAEAVRGPLMRIGIATGEVLAEGSAVTGEPVAEAVRLAREAAPGEVLAADGTLALAAGAVETEGARVISVAPGRPAFPQRTEAPLVGRDAQLEQLRELFATVAEERRCRVVTVFGEAGIGKSRLGRELVAALGEGARVLVGRCVAYGEGVTYLPLREALREVDVASTLAGAEQGEQLAQRIAELTGEAEGPSTTGDSFWAVRQLLETLARERPVLLALDDVHWAEPTFLDLVAYLAEWSTEAPILVLCLARPDLADKRPAWGGATSPIVSIALQPLSTDDSLTLVAALATGVPEETRAEIAQAAEGNPLYAEQLTAYAEESGAEALATVPPTIEALLASRLDRLATEERTTLERASVVGREFTHDALVHLLPREAAGAAGRHLLALARRGLLGPGRTPAPPGDAFRFHHVLIRDVAYNGIAKETRADLHERHADWLDQHAEDEAIVGYHFEHAYLLRQELGAKDGHTRRLADAAGEKLGAAGMRAWRIGDALAGTNLLGRATQLLPKEHPRWPELMRQRAGALWAVGDVDGAVAAFVEAISAAERIDAHGIALRAHVDLVHLRLFTDPEGRGDELRELATRAIPVFETLGDDRSLGSIWLALAYLEGGHSGRYAACMDALERAHFHYERLGWLPSSYVHKLAGALYYGPAAVVEALARCRSLLEGADRSSRALLLTYVAGLEAMQANFTEARLLTFEAREAYEELGWGGSLAISWAPVAADIELLAGESQAALELLRTSCTELERRHERGPLSTQAGQLAHVLAASGAYDEARHWVAVSESLAAPDDLSSQLWWRGARSRLLADHGSSSEAESLARGAVAMSEASDALNARGRIRVDLAEVLRSAGRHDEARRSFGEAIALFEQKGNQAAAAITKEISEEQPPA